MLAAPGVVDRAFRTNRCTGAYLKKASSSNVTPRPAAAVTVRAAGRSAGVCSSSRAQP